MVLLLSFEQFVKFVFIGPIFVGQGNRVDFVDVIVFFRVTSRDVVDVVTSFCVTLFFVHGELADTCVIGNSLSQVFVESLRLLLGLTQRWLREIHLEHVES